MSENPYKSPAALLEADVEPGKKKASPVAKRVRLGVLAMQGTVLVLAIANGPQSILIPYVSVFSFPAILFQDQLGPPGSTTAIIVFVANYVLMSYLLGCLLGWVVERNFNP